MSYKYSELGKHWNGDDLTEDNVHSGVKVSYNNNMFYTGNRGHGLVDLHFGCPGKFYSCVNLSKIKLVKSVLEEQHEIPTELPKYISVEPDFDKMDLNFAECNGGNVIKMIEYLENEYPGYEFVQYFIPVGMRQYVIMRKK